jgi:polyphosphate kinase
MRRKEWQYESQYAIIEVPVTANGRFVLLPTDDKEQKDVMLLEDVIIYNLPHIFPISDMMNSQHIVLK